MIVLGIDPGTLTTGYGLVKKNKNQIEHIDNGLISPKTKEPLAQRLKVIFEALFAIMQQFSPNVIALEDVFFAKNAKASLKLGQARGVAMLAAATLDIPIFEYPATQVKQAITGFGGASKEQMQKMVQIHLKLPEIAYEDASDALAVALCHCQTLRFDS